MRSCTARLILILALGILAAPLAAEAQQAGKVYRIGFLRPGQPPRSYIEAFQRGLRERGYFEGQNVSIEYRFPEGDFDQLVRLAGEFARLKVDVILASGGPAARAAQKATTAVPIVFVGVYDPVEQGLVAGLAHPGGNVTGLSVTSADLSGKRLEALKELVPGLRRVAVLWERSNPGNQIQLTGAEAAARVLGLKVQSLPVQTPEDFESALRAARSAGALFLVDAPMFANHRTRLVALAARGRLPAIYGFRAFVEAGGLMSYGVDVPHLYAGAGMYVDKILKGAKPADLPVEQPTKFELVINLKTAKALGLTIPQSVLIRADEVIQ